MSPYFPYFPPKTDAKQRGLYDAGSDEDGRSGDGDQAGATRVKLDAPQTVFLNLFVQRR
jgi:hypothetical protein